jgi:hypothetical protein
MLTINQAPSDKVKKIAILQEDIARKADSMGLQPPEILSALLGASATLSVAVDFSRDDFMAMAQSFYDICTLVSAQVEGRG